MNMKKYIFPTIAVLCILLGFFVGESVSNRVNAQHFYIHNGQLMMSPSSKADQMIQLIAKRDGNGIFSPVSRLPPE